MTITINDRDLLLQAASPRLNQVTSNFISYTSSAPSFIVNGAVTTPASITITFMMHGRLYGNPDITFEGVTGVTVSNISPLVTTVTIHAANMLEDACRITATLPFLGINYSTSTIIDGSISAPSAPGVITSNPEGLNIRLAWPRNSEVDVIGYEVRLVDANWGTDSLYLYNGSATTCTVPPGTLGTPKTYYIQAYDTSNLYSSTTIGTYTVLKPTAPTGVTATFSNSSNTLSTALLTWTNTIPLFGFKQYRVRVTLPNTSFTDTIVNTPNVSINATWSGTATVLVYVTDILGNESDGSISYNLVKNAPNNVTTPISITPVGTKLLLNWAEVTKTSLPIVAYEVRLLDSNWGDGNTHTWKGNVSECQVLPGTLDSLTNYYVKAIDSDNVYSPIATASQYTVTYPPIPTSSSLVYSTDTIGQANATIKWPRPIGETFALQLYRLTITKPGPIVVSTDTYSNAWTVNADWEGSAALTIKTLDVLNSVSTDTFSKSLIKVATNVSSCTFTTTPVDSTLLLKWTAPTIRTGISWTRVTTTATVSETAHGYVVGTIISITDSSSILAIPIGTYTITSSTANTYTFICLNAGLSNGTLTDSTQSSLPIAQYELRASDNITVLYKGPSSSYAIQSNNISVGANTWYLYAIDTSGKYSSNTKIITYTYVILSGITAAVSPTFTTNGTALFKWNVPSIGSFDPMEYSLQLTGTFTTITVVRSTTDWEIPVNWTDSTATLTITPKDVLGTVGTPTILTLTNILLGPPSVPSSLLRGTNLELDWVDNIISPTTQLPIGWYEIRDYTNTNVVWKGKTSWASISLIGVVPAQNTWYLHAYDYNGYPAIGFRTYNYASLVNPSPVPIPTYSFGTNISDSLLNVTWVPQTPLFGLDYYEVTYIDSDTTVITNVVSHSLAVSPIPKNTGSTVWTGDKYFNVVVVDKLGNRSSVSTKAVTKNPPGVISNYTAQVIDNNVLLGWTLPIRTTLPLNTARIKKGISWEIGSIIGDKTGTFTTILERAGGNYTYWIAAVDNDGVEGSPIPITSTVAQPPDYIFNGQLYSQFNGTVTGNISGNNVTLSSVLITSNAQIDHTGVTMPVDLTSTWTQHYTNNGWGTPDAQIAAGYPIYIQPTISSGYYEETFDYGQVFSSTKITINKLDSIIAGIVSIVVTIDTSPDGTNWLVTPYTGISMFAVNFRYVRVRITVSQTDGGHGTYKLNNLDVSLDSKAINDAGTYAVVSTHVDGTIANFNIPFVDVGAINCTSNGTTPLDAIADFKDAVITGTYSITSNVCTVTTTAAHGFSGSALGQKVRLAFTTGGAPSGVYAITGVSGGTPGVVGSYSASTVYTVSIVTANTSGTLSTYSQGSRLYLFNNAGTQVSGTVSQAVRGY
jgi:hypothetical protein